MLRQLIKSTLYVKVFRNRLQVRQIEAGREETRSATEPFTTKRLLIGQFNAAEALLNTIIKELYKDHWLKPSPVVVIQPMEMIEGGLSEVEHRVLMEVSSGAGARKVTVWTGDVLSDQQVLEKTRQL
jgi:hypothetical protein